METKNDSNCSPLEQELARKASELDGLRAEREGQLVETTLKAIAGRVASKSVEILQILSEKGRRQDVCEVVIREVKRAAEGLLWCPEYLERLGSEQHVKVYTGSHWEDMEPQLWKDFTGWCAQRCGVPESMCMDHKLMGQLAEGLAYNVAESRRQCIPESEVWLNLCNGTLVVRTDGSLELRPHCKEDLFNYTLGYAYDPKAESQLWQGFLDRVLPEPESQQVLAEFIDYCFAKHHKLEKMLWLFGEGLNGKSVTLEVLESLLGSTNVSYLSLSDVSNDEVKRAAIEDKLLNVSHESGKDVNPNVLKQLTSGERVLIKHLYVDPRMTANYGKFVAAFNQLPRAELTFGYFRRLIILPYLVTIPQNEIDRELTSKLRRELSGILNWALRALPRLMQTNTFTESPNCMAALDQYRLQSDNVRLFVRECCEESAYTTAASELFLAYRGYCQESSMHPLGKVKFYERLEKLVGAPEVYDKMKRFKIQLRQS